MKLILGPVYREDCFRKADWKGRDPEDVDDLARLFTIKLSRCLALDAEGTQNLLFQKAGVTAKEMKKVGIHQVQEHAVVNLLNILMSAAGFEEDEATGELETRLVAVTQPSTNIHGVDLVGVVALNDSRELIQKLMKKARGDAN